MNEIVARYLSSIGDPRQVVADPTERYFGAKIDDRSLTPGAQPRIGPTALADWMRDEARARH